MPHLGSFLVCEKIILDQQSKPTLITLFQGLIALVPEGQEVPKDTITGTPWSVFCEWFFDDSELDKRFEQVIEVVMPDGTPTPIRGRLPLKEVAKDRQGTRAYISLFGMPISQTGFLSVNVWLELDSKRVTDTFSYLVKIAHAKEPPVPNDGSTLAPIFPALTQTKPS